MALPSEHGGWSFLAEPIAAGLLVAPSGAGLAIALATVAAFLVRHPARIWWKNRARTDPSPRHAAARAVAAAYGLLATLALGAAGLLAGPGALVPFAVAAPFVLVFAVFDLRYESRRLLPEILAPAAIAVAAPAIALADGWSGPSACALWALLALRAVPTVLYVRARLRLEKEKPADRVAAVGAHAAALAGGAALAVAGLAPALPAAGLALLLGRAAVGLSSRRKRARPKQVGLSEIAWGSLFVLLIALGYRLGL
ncbi:MAG: YwiC-like family protein [Gemmatimonadota bacterium]